MHSLVPCVSVVALAIGILRTLCLRFSSGVQNESFRITSWWSPRQPLVPSVSVASERGRFEGVFGRYLQQPILFREKEREGRIVGGKPVAAGKYPFFAFPAGSLLCGATLFHGDMLLSAAHCAGAFSVGALVGGTTLDGSRSLFVEVVEEIVHPRFDKDSFQNDIMIVKLRDLVPQETVSLEFREDLPQPGEYYSVVGFGEKLGRSEFSQELREVDVPVLSHKACSRHFRGDIDDHTMICAGGEKGRDSCTGDSGGPLLTTNGSQVGIVSFGDGCARAKVPAVYTRVSAFRTWIMQTVCRESNEPPPSCRQEEPSSLLQSDLWQSILSGFHSTNSATTSATDEIRGPTIYQTNYPSQQPTIHSSARPTIIFSDSPSPQPSVQQTHFHSELPSHSFSLSPFLMPTQQTTSFPSWYPSLITTYMTDHPSSLSNTPSVLSSSQPAPPIWDPSDHLSAEEPDPSAAIMPSIAPTSMETPRPTAAPTVHPTLSRSAHAAYTETPIFPSAAPTTPVSSSGPTPGSALLPPSADTISIHQFLLTADTGEPSDSNDGDTAKKEAAEPTKSRKMKTFKRKMEKRARRSRRRRRSPAQKHRFQP